MSPTPRLTDRIGLALVLVLAARAAPADWPTLRGNPAHTGYVQAELRPPFRLAWAREFAGERLGTALEPIVAASRVFVATHQGSLYALDAASGQCHWRLAAPAPILQSPGYGEGVVVLGCAGGPLLGVAAEDGRRLWSQSIDPAGYAAAPVVAGNWVYVGSRGGQFVAVEVRSGKLRWRVDLGAPIRQTAAVADDRVFVTAEDLQVRCFAADTGRLLWTSEPLTGQSARDYYPVVVQSGDRTYAIVRTNPTIDMAQRIARDRSVLARNAGIDDGDWRKVEAWTQSEQAQGDPSLWAQEQRAILAHLETHRDARTCFVLDGRTGEAAGQAPVLWVAGCQGVGAPPALTAEGDLLIFNRSAYGNWNRGVAPLVGLGLLTLGEHRVTPLFHRNGRQPPWNTFWGTADESQNFVVAGDTVLIVHQGTLSGFDLRTRELFRIHGERDTFGGLPSPTWARNEWHGPGRGGVAVVGSRLYWLTGSRVLCLAAGEAGKPALPERISSPAAVAEPHDASSGPERTALRQRLAAAVTEFLEARWAPLYVEPGLAGRDFVFDHSGEAFETLAWAYAELPEALQSRVKAWLAEEWQAHPPYSQQGWYALNRGTRRERFWIPAEVLTRVGADQPHHPFGNLHAVGRYAGRCAEWPRVLAAWADLASCYRGFVSTGWRLEATRGDLHANRYLASLLAFEQIATRAGETDLAQQARQQAEATGEALMAWWQRAAATGTLTAFRGVGELDPFIGRGDALSFRVAPHRHRVALLAGLTPEVATRVRAAAAAAVEAVWQTYEQLYATWWLAGEERQVHFGENFVDPPDLALGGFGALAWLRAAPAAALADRVDLPFGRADLYYVRKLAVTLASR